MERQAALICSLCSGAATTAVESGAAMWVHFCTEHNAALPCSLDSCIDSAGLMAALANVAPDGGRFATLTTLSLDRHPELCRFFDAAAVAAAKLAARTEGDENDAGAAKANNNVTVDDDDDDDDDGWEDDDGDDGAADIRVHAKCLFCDVRCDDPVRHMKEAHGGFDLALALSTAFGQDPPRAPSVHHRIAVVNAVRRAIAAGQCPRCGDDLFAGGQQQQQQRQQDAGEEHDEGERAHGESAHFALHPDHRMPHAIPDISGEGGEQWLVPAIRGDGMLSIVMALFSEDEDFSSDDGDD